jgi:hypothetical protein
MTPTCTQIQEGRGHRLPGGVHATPPFWPRLASSALALLALVAITPRARADHPAVGLGAGVSGPIVTIPAHTLPAGRWAASLRVESVNFHSFSDSELVRLAPAAGTVHSTDKVVSPSLSIAYGFSETFMLSARMPMVTRHDIREAHVHADLSVGTHDHGNSSGVGDLTMLGTFGVWKGARSKIALLTGLKVPTGQTHVDSDDDERFETEHQPGSGSWDFLEGIAWSNQVGFGSIDANMLATFASEGAQETNLGTAFYYNVALSGHLGGGAGHEHHDGKGSRPHGHGGTVGADLILELNGEARSRVKIAGEEEEHTGGNLIYLSPGIRFGPPESWSLSASVGAPVLQDLNGTQHETDLRLLIGFATGF